MPKYQNKFPASVGNNSDQSDDNSCRRGRPSKFTNELANAIVNRIADGEALRQICFDDDMPTRETLRRWLNDRPDFYAKYVQARGQAADDQFDEVYMLERLLITERKDITMTEINAIRTAIDSRKWRLGRMSGKYNDKLVAGCLIPVGKNKPEAGKGYVVFSPDDWDVIQGEGGAAPV